MKEIIGDFGATEADWKCIPTNLTVDKNGNAVMGSGIAGELAARYPKVKKEYGERIQSSTWKDVAEMWWDEYTAYISFPTKFHWWNTSDLDLIAASATALKQRYDFAKEKPSVILLPRPGCGCGGLKWEEVKPVLEEILVDDVFVIIDK